MPPGKLLVVGSVNGALRAFFKKVGQLHAKHQFAALLVVGQLFADEAPLPADSHGTDAPTTAAAADPAAGDGAPAPAAATASEVVDLIEGRIPIPLPTYALAPPNGWPAAVARALAAQQLPTGLRLSIDACAATALPGGFQTVMLDGRAVLHSGAETPHRAAIEALMAQPPPSVDLLLSFHAPSVAPSSTSTPAAPRRPRPIPSPAQDLPTHLNALLAPQYHFAPSPAPDAAAEFLPYRLTRGRSGCTRVITLAAYGNARKAKWMYAMTVTPAAEEITTDLPDGVLPSPFIDPDAPRGGASTADAQARAAAAAAAPTSFFFADSGAAQRAAKRRPVPADYLCHRCRVPGHWEADCPLRGHQGPDGHTAPPEGYVCRACHEPGHYIQHCPVRAARAAVPPDQRPVPEGYVCRQCHVPGHWRAQCPSSPAASLASDAAGASSRDDALTVICHRCRQPGHWARGCPEAGGGGGGGGGAAAAAASGDANDAAAPRTPALGYLCTVCGSETHFVRDCPERGRTYPRLPARPKDACWFCLSQPSFEKHLVAAVGAAVFASVAKGPLDPAGKHCLLIPIHHLPSASRLLPALGDPAAWEPLWTVWKDVMRFQARLARWYAAAEPAAQCVMFEVGAGATLTLPDSVRHWHVACVPVPRSVDVEAAFRLEVARRKLRVVAVRHADAAAQARADADADAAQAAAADANGIYHDPVPLACRETAACNGDRHVPAEPEVPFLRVWLGDTTLVVTHPDLTAPAMRLSGGRAATQHQGPLATTSMPPSTAAFWNELPRVVLAKALGHTDRVNWRRCIGTVDEETAMGKALKHALTPSSSG